jgi:hypothetical protein
MVPKESTMQRAVVLAAVLLAACGSSEGLRDPALEWSAEASSSVSSATRRDGGTTVCREDDDDEDEVDCEKDDDKDGDHRGQRSSGRGGNHSDGCKVRICHGPSGQQNTIRISSRALKAHLKHGDHVGKCRKCPPPPPVCPPPACVPQGGACSTFADCCVQTNPPLFCVGATGSGVCAPAG